MRVLVCGSRTFDDWEVLCQELNGTYYRMDPPDLTEDGKVDFTIIEGGAIGADFLSRVWAKWRMLPFREYPADWKKYGKAAGSIRNQEMLDKEHPDLVLAFWDGQSKGTQHMCDIAEDAGIEVKIILFK